ncbi:chromatin modification-related protein eaf1-like [Coffea eugenioides]|uniref:Uncharacterized protein n=1 Tax=Coffea arabica TaxID=13443 RepID=A0A6P6UIX0_COFAR|nr:chromatin modification-related protein eaf1-like [Coffea arabica]XP_027149937.1 chromatin modification-related protein eaf1-like [Coffea eugenioides]
MAVVDDSFKKPGAVPFKWEVRPGLPKAQLQQPEQYEQKRRSFHCSPSFVLRQQLQEQLKEAANNTSDYGALPDTPTKLAPPPAGFCFQAEPRTRSFPSPSRTRSERYHFNNSTLAQPENVLSSGCFPTSPFLISMKNDRKKTKKQHKLKVRPESKSEPDSASDLGKLSPWSVSSRASMSPFWDSPFSSSFSSRRSSPRPVNDAEWAGFGLF